MNEVGKVFLKIVSGIFKYIGYLCLGFGVIFSGIVAFPVFFGMYLETKTNEPLCSFAGYILEIPWACTGIYLITLLAKANK